MASATHIASIPRLVNDAVTVCEIEVTPVDKTEGGPSLLEEAGCTDWTRVRFPDGSLHDVRNELLRAK